MLFRSKDYLFYRKPPLCCYAVLFFRLLRRFLGAVSAVGSAESAGLSIVLLPRICKITSPLLVVVCDVAGWALAAELVFWAG